MLPPFWERVWHMYIACKNLAGHRIALCTYELLFFLLMPIPHDSMMVSKVLEAAQSSALEAVCDVTSS